MSHRSETPFDNIESSHEYVSLLAEAIEEAIAEVEADIALAGADGAERRKEALQLVLFNLNKLQWPYDHQPPDSQRSANFAPASPRRADVWQGLPSGCRLATWTGGSPNSTPASLHQCIPISPPRA